MEFNATIMLFSSLCSTTTAPSPSFVPPPPPPPALLAAIYDPPQDDHGLTPLALALITGCHEAASRLASLGADVSAADTQGVAPAHRAAGHGDLSALELLSGGGADFETQSGAGTPLHWAAGEVRKGIVLTGQLYGRRGAGAGVGAGGVTYGVGVAAWTIEVLRARKGKVAAAMWGGRFRKWKPARVTRRCWFGSGPCGGVVFVRRETAARKILIS